MKRGEIATISEAEEFLRLSLRVNPAGGKGCSRLSVGA
jgi:hypothetical protein